MTDFLPENTTPLEASAVPIGSFADRTKGKAPRSREASSREATSRVSQEELNHYEKMFEMEQLGRTYMPKEATPPGFVGMWVRTAVFGQPDASNVQMMQLKGWRKCSADLFPKAAFQNTYGDITDDRSLIERHGLMWMLRDESIHKAELSVQERKRNHARRFCEGSRTVGVQGSFMTGRGTDGRTVTFTEDPHAQYIASLFNHTNFA